MESVIKVEHVSKVYKIYDDPKDLIKEDLGIGGDKQYHKKYSALNDLSFEIGKGEIVGVVGRNGSGKSPILKILTGVLNPTAGDVTINGKVYPKVEVKAIPGIIEELRKEGGANA